MKVKNGSGTYIDYSSYVESIKIDQDIDQPISGCTIELRRDNGPTLSLAPLRTDSTLNRLDDGTTYSPAIDLSRAITVEITTNPIGTSPVAGDYKKLFEGTVDTVNFERSPVVVSCRDLGAPLVDRWIEAVAIYGSTPGVALETVMGQVLNATFGGTILLYTPVSPSYLVSPAYIQQKQSMMDAQYALAQLPGWDVRFRWDDGTSAFRFTLSEPPRSKTVPDHTFSPSDYFEVTRLELDLTNIKNVITVSYHDTATDARTEVTVFDATSITKYGRRYFFIQEPDGSPINTNAEATTMANAALSDLKEPKAEFEIDAPFFWPGDLWDLYRFPTNSVHFNTNQDWAVVSLTHTLSRKKHRTILRVRGQPAGGYSSWIGRERGQPTRPGEVGPEAHIEVFGVPSATQTQVRYFSSGGTTPITYERRIDVDNVSTGTWSAPALLGSGALEWITMHAGDRLTRVFLRVTDATGLQGNADPFVIPGQGPATNPDTGLPKRTTQYTDGGYAARTTDATGLALHSTVTDSASRLLTKALVKANVADPDTLDGVPDGATYKRVAGVTSNLVQTASIATAAVTPDKTEARSRCLVYLTAHQSIANNTGTVLAFAGEVYDVNSLHDNVTNNSRITIPTGGNTGVWKFSAQVQWASNATGVRSLAILKNGSQIARVQGPPANGLTTYQHVMIDDNAPTVGDYFEAWVLQTSGVSIDAVGLTTASTWFSAVHLW